MDYQSQKGKISLLRYRALFEERELVKEQVELGSADLAYHLNFFKKKLKTSVPGQQSSFDKTFFRDFSSGKDSQVIPSAIANTSHRGSKNKPKWVKSIYKKIVASTHPDKLSSIMLDSLIEKLTAQYMLAVESYNNDQYENLLMVANDIGVKFSDNLVDKYVVPKIKILEDDILSNKNILGYQWYHIHDSQKQQQLKKYLTMLGFVFTEDQVADAIKKGRKNSRKVGTRPVKMGRRRLK